MGTLYETEWGPSSKRWDLQHPGGIAARAALDFSPEDAEHGTFVMRFKDFCDTFRCIWITKHHDGYVNSSAPAAHKVGKVSRASLTVPPGEPVHVYVSLHNAHRRSSTAESWSVDAGRVRILDESRMVVAQHISNPCDGNAVLEMITAEATLYSGEYTVEFDTDYGIADHFSAKPKLDFSARHLSAYGSREVQLGPASVTAEPSQILQAAAARLDKLSLPAAMHINVDPIWINGKPECCRGKDEEKTRAFRFDLVDQSYWSQLRSGHSSLKYARPKWYAFLPDGQMWVLEHKPYPDVTVRPGPSHA